MPKPNIIEVCKTDLFTPEADLNERFGPVTVAHVMRIREEYQWALANPDFADRQFIEQFQDRTGLKRAQLYADLSIIKQILPALASASREWYRWKANQMLLETYQKAKARKDTKTMERAASSFAKYNRVDLEDEQTIPLHLILVQPFTVTADPSVLGIKPIPNAEAEIARLKKKYAMESVDIEDVEAETVDLEEDSLWSPIAKEDDESGEADILQ